MSFDTHLLLRPPPPLLLLLLADGCAGALRQGPAAACFFSENNQQRMRRKIRVLGGLTATTSDMFPYVGLHQSSRSQKQLYPGGFVCVVTGGGSHALVAPVAKNKGRGHVMMLFSDTVHIYIGTSR
jgi:hypothetical protein